MAGTPGAKATKGQAPEAKNKVVVSFLEELELLSDDEVNIAHLGGASRLRLKAHLEKGLDYISAKRLVIQKNFLESKEPAKPLRLGPVATTSRKAGKGTKATKRPRSISATPPQTSQLSKKPRHEGVSFKDALSSVKVAVVHTGFPEVKMSTERLTEVQDSVSEALDQIPVGGPQVRFAKCTHKPGYLVMMCVDRTSADWLKEVITTIKLWEGATLTVLEEDDLPETYACTTSISDERGQKPEAEKILHRLKVANHGLNTHLWTVWGKTPAAKGQTRVFSMDKKSLGELVKLDMSPYYNLGRIKFRQKGKHVKEKEEDAEPIEAAQEAQEEDEAEPSQSGSSPLKRPIAHESATPMEEGDASMKAEEGFSSQN
ncbi:unnamed protein product [Phaedon cochleariae]|uniref:DUF4780 domain-containing protein n=1 Tax=Phaedon cochleariae TaxID=80249 RepID=A0A9N9SAW0_PHACE|nr:unnamed protein product [Phaedon cochleariae]